MIIIQIVVLAIAAFLHGLTGMGFPMIATTALSLTMPLPTAIVITAIPCLFIHFLVLIAKDRQQYTFFYTLEKYKLLIISSLIGGVAGIFCLKSLPAAYMYLIMAIVTLTFVITDYLNGQGKMSTTPIAVTPINTVLFGFIAGAIGSATNAMSPILLFYLFSATKDKHEIVKSSNICYFCGKLLQLALLHDNLRQLNYNDIFMMSAMTGGALLLLFIGIKCRHKLSDRFFRHLIHLILLLLAIKIGYSGIQSLLYS